MNNEKPTYSPFVQQMYKAERKKTQMLCKEKFFLESDPYCEARANTNRYLTDFHLVKNQEDFKQKTPYQQQFRTPQAPRTFEAKVLPKIEEDIPSTEPKILKARKRASQVAHIGSCY